MEILSYDLDLDVDFGKALVRGKETVTLKGAASPLRLDCAELEVASVSVNGKKAPFRLDKKNSKLVIRGVPKKLSRVELSYTKQVSDDVIFGLYKSKYGKDYILATDLEPSQARTVFPCVDEPAYKAVFRLKVTTDDGLGVVANTPAAATESAGKGRTRYTFEDTPRMSTYLFFFAIGNLEETVFPAGSAKVITATRPGQAKNSVLAGKIIAEALVEYQRYYGVPYPLKKLHLVALPEYHTGAMENWGAISSREGYALVTDSTSFLQRNRGLMSMVHEVAHQWFGDLVTMKWWDDLWLNESFATLMGYKTTDKIHPDWEMWGVFLRDEGFKALNEDALSTTHPVQSHAKTVEEAVHNFDHISYGKGACVLRMLEGYVGEESFRKGVSSYLKRFSFGNASGKDLWDSLGRESGLPVAKVAREWLTRPGFPVVEARSGSGGITLSQRPFHLSGMKSAGHWPIPITMRANGHETSAYFDRPSLKLDLAGDSDLLLNLGRKGFYATLYDEAGYGRISSNFSKIAPHDRAGLMFDLYLFLQAGLVRPEQYAHFVALCGANPEATTTQVVTEQLMDLYAIANDSRVLSKVTPNYYPPLIAAFGEDPRPGEAPFVAATREYLTSQYASMDEGYARRMSDRFAHFADLDPSLKAAAAIGYAVTEGAKAEKTLQQMAKTLQGEVDRAKVYEGLSAFREPELVQHTLDLGLSGEVSRSDSGHTLVGPSFNPYARDTTWKWITRRYDEMLDLYAGSQQFYLYMGYAIPLCAVGHETEAKRFLSGKRLKQGGSSVTRILEQLHINAGLRKRLMTGN